MFTLNKKITATWFLSEDSFDALTAHWSKLVNDKESRKKLTSVHYMVYAILRGKNWHKCFTKPTNVNKLANGYHPAYAAKKAWSVLFNLRNSDYVLAPFKDFVTPDALVKIRALITSISFNMFETEPYNTIWSEEDVVRAGISTVILNNNHLINKGTLLHQEIDELLQIEGSLVGAVG